MHFEKIDAGLASALSDRPPGKDEEFLVSVRTARQLTPAEQREFHQLGGGGDYRLPVLSAKVSREGIETLAKKPWVRLVSLARRLYPS